MTTDHFNDAYVPDAEADTAAVVEGFFDHLSAYDVPAMRARHEELIAGNGHLVVDEPARHNLRMTLLLVAAHEVLTPVLGAGGAVEAVRAAFVEPLAPAVRAATAAMLDAAPDPYRAMVELVRAREVDAFGAGFAFEHPVDDDSRFEADVRRCFYYDVLMANGASELAPVMCEFDRSWIDAIEPGRHGFRFERVTTIGTGGSHCPFHFGRTG
ncbi:L-2-amino-thiazoline-4-carboxylic acid hydrolase [Saccharothrix syringae]|uniref:L-2-amino-thiazoline-4-carboxylic acid hydrolase n=1 Tax=Saccharothrix syringae TaxID=103733 RepID=A0A5Q0HAT7_SACSY|nr:L-2-amino-thiazoline-4-carboxylic acid hydrolase [Saccharothrix syringae]QFZ23055.1 hypothetical protein EKG83_41510 [Saccharothrix syringae]